MRTIHFIAVLFALAVSCSSLTAATPTDEVTKAAAKVEPVPATVDSSLTTAKPQIRMFAFDGNPDSYFESSNNPTASDTFTLTFDKAVAVKSAAVVTGRLKGGEILEKGALEVSEDGKTFESLAQFAADGTVKADAKGRKLLAVRIKPTEDMKNPLAVREFTIDSDPPVAVFKYPVEVFVDVTEVPEMKEWTEKTARVNERQYQMICEELKSDGFTPKTVVNMVMTNSYKGVAATWPNGTIKGDPSYFKAHVKDVGAMVHEMVHVAQAYRGRGNPGWLVEGIADYIRCYKYEGGKLRRVNPDTAKYDQSYQITAHFLHYVAEKYDADLVNKMNKAMREGKYKEDLWNEITKKPLTELGDEWKASLKK